MKYRLTTAPKGGIITRNRIIGGVAIVTVVGVISVGSIFAKAKADNYGYNDKFSNYSTQLETVLDVDIEDKDAEKLDKLQRARDLINDYDSGMGEVVENSCIKGLIDMKNDLIDIGLDIAKTSIAKEYGETKDDYKLSLDTREAIWSAVKKDEGPITIDGSVNDLAFAIGHLQNYDDVTVEEIEDKDKFVDVCNDLIVSAGEVTVDMSKQK